MVQPFITNMLYFVTSIVCLMYMWEKKYTFKRTFVKVSNLNATMNDIDLLCSGSIFNIYFMKESKEFLCPKQSLFCVVYGIPVVVYFPLD